MSLNAFALSGEQVASRDLGVRQQAISLAIGLGEEASAEVLSRVQASAEDAGARDIVTRISSFSVRPDTLPRRFDTGLQKVVSYIEIADVDQAFPGSYRLVSGTWPAKAGEVVLSEDLAAQINSPKDFSAFSGAVRLQVTGIVEPVYGEQSWRMLAAPGTWSSLPERQIASGFPSSEGSFTLFWNGDASPTAIAEAATASAPGDEASESVMTSHLSRSRLVQESGSPLTARMPLVHTYPSAIVGALVALLVAILNRHRCTSNLRKLHAVGVRRRPIRAAMVISLTAMALLASLLGSTVGFLLGLASRATWLPLVVLQPLSPVSSPVYRTGLLLVLTFVVAALSGWMTFTLERRRRGRLAGLLDRVPWPIVRRVVGAIAIIRAVPAVSSATTLDTLGSGAAWMLVGFLLLAPDLLHPVVWTLRTGRAVPLLARRFIESDRGRYAVAITALAACVGLPTATGTFVATQTRTEAAGTVSQVPLRQIVVDIANSNPATADQVQRIVADSSAVQGAPVAVSVVSSDREDIRFEHSGRSGAFAIWVVEDADDLAAMLDGRLSAGAREALNAGGIVDWSGARETQRIVMTNNSGDQSFSDVLPTADIGANSAYRARAAGAILASTARSEGLPTITSRYVFPGLSDDAIRGAVRDVVDAGYDARFVEYHVTPPPTRPTAEWYVASGGLAIAAFAVIWVILAGQARHLRTHAERLLAMGVRTKWSARVLMLQAGITVSLGLIVGVAAGAIPISLFALLSIPGIVLDVPWRFIAIAVASTSAAALVASLASLRSLRPKVTE